MLNNLKSMDSKRRYFFKKKELKFKVFKSFFYNQTISLPLRLKISVKKSFHLFLTRVKNKCIITNRNRFILSKFKLSRQEFRRQIASNLLPGFRKSSW